MLNRLSYQRPNLARAEHGIALLVAVIFTSVILAIGLALGSLGYKQVSLASSATASQEAFYAADAALECVLYADQREAAFAAASTGTFHCGGNTVSFSAPVTVSGGGNSWDKYTIDHVTLGEACAQVIIYKPTVRGAGATYLFSSGYDNADCTIADRTTVRGINMHYSTLAQ
ncbi:MAG TPA: pilus assembly PilX N-terminal domain-containing protein [Candidatus Paceibacterota bacterium]